MQHFRKMRIAQFVAAGAVLSFIFHMSRCGSTLASQLLAASPALAIAAVSAASMAPTLLPGDQVLVVTPRSYRTGDVVVEDGDPVSPGQPIVRLHPEAV